MTKKELLEHAAFKALPDDSEIVFNTNDDLRKCVPLRDFMLTATHQDYTVELTGGNPFATHTYTALVIDAKPNRWF